MFFEEIQTVNDELIKQYNDIVYEIRISIVIEGEVHYSKPKMKKYELEHKIKKLQNIFYDTFYDLLKKYNLESDESIGFDTYSILEIDIDEAWREYNEM